MVNPAPFPLPFKSLRTISGEGSKPFIVGAMFTASYTRVAERLAASCEKFSLPYELHEVLCVHRSISVHGNDDLSFTKANFIHHLLQSHKMPVLYLDADCEFTSQPDLIAELVKTGCDFAIYNWFADEYTDKFRPIDLSLADLPAAEGRYFRFSGSVDLYSTTQLLCSGMAQFYGNSRSARALLLRWHQAVVANPGCADDGCLNFAYNNIGRRSWLYWLLKSRWLPKAYARYAFWIYVEPVINHGDFPALAGFRPVRDPSGRSEYYKSLLQRKRAAGLLPRDCIIDTELGLVCKLVDNQLVVIGPANQTFWLKEPASRQ